MVECKFIFLKFLAGLAALLAAPASAWAHDGHGARGAHGHGDALLLGLLAGATLVWVLLREREGR